MSRVLRAVVLALLAAILAGLLAFSGQQAAVAACTPPAGAFHIGTHNVLRGTATFTRFAGIIGWQEVNEPEHRTKMRNQLGDDYRHYISTNGAAAAVPVSWRWRRFELTGARSVKVHDGLAKVTPSRWITVVHLRERATGRQVTFLNTHFISGAFKADSTYREWRLARWREHAARLREVIGQVRTNRPNTAIYVVGDFNRHGYLDLSGQRVHPLRLGTLTPIDHLYAGLPGRGGCVERLDAMGSDHHRWRAAAWFG